MSLQNNSKLLTTRFEWGLFHSSSGKFRIRTLHKNYISNQNRKKMEVKDNQSQSNVVDNNSSIVVNFINGEFTK